MICTRAIRKDHRNEHHGRDLAVIAVPDGQVTQAAGAHGASDGGIGQNRPFNNNPALRQIIIGPKVDYLSPDFFEGCTNLQVVKLSNPEISAPMAKALGQLGGNAWFISATRLLTSRKL